MGVVTEVGVGEVTGGWHSREEKTGLLLVDWRMTGDGRRVMSVRGGICSSAILQGGGGGSDGWDRRTLCCVLWFGALLYVGFGWARWARFAGPF